MGNLRLLCKPCHNTVTHSHFRRVTDPAMAARRDSLVARIYAAEPMVPCDATDWHANWQKWITDHAGYADHVNRSPKRLRQ